MTREETKSYLDLAYDIVCRGDIPIHKVLRVRKATVAEIQKLADQLRYVYYANIISDRAYARGVKKLSRQLMEVVGIKKIENRRQVRFNRESRCYELVA